MSKVTKKELQEQLDTVNHELAKTAACVGFLCAVLLEGFNAEEDTAATKRFMRGLEGTMRQYLAAQASRG